MLYTNKKYDGIGFGATTGSTAVVTTKEEKDNNVAATAIIAAGNALSTIISGVWGSTIQYNYLKDTAKYRNSVSQTYGYPSSVGGTTGSSSMSFLTGNNILIAGGIGILLLGAVLFMRRRAS